MIHCLFIGSPGGGKTSLIKNLTRQPLNLDHVLPSTGVAEKPLLVKVFASTTAAMASLSEDAEWSILNFNAEAGYIMAKAAEDDTAIDTKDPATMASEDTAAKATPSGEALTSTLNTPSHDCTVPFIRAQCNLPSDIIPATPMPSDALITSICSHVADEEGLKNMQQYLQQSFLLYLTDTGGQSEFQELLPALNAGPALFFLVFRLDQDLDETVSIQFRYPDGSMSDPRRSGFTVRESLLRSLASIASTVSYKYITERGEVRAVAVKPTVLFVGTHLDKIDESKRKQIDDDLKEMVRDTSFCKFIEYADRKTKKLVVPVSNLYPADSDCFKQVRTIVMRIANRPRDDYQVILPSRWFLFSLAIRKSNQDVLPYEDCIGIGQKCAIDNLDEALSHLSDVVGLVRHFKVKGLREIVIVNPQILFNMITHLIFSTFNDSNVDSDTIDEFEKRGIFSCSDLRDIEDKQIEKPLTVDQFLRLLEHLHIIFRLHGADERYFMPCILTNAQSIIPEISHSSAVLSTQQVPPLLLTFKCGYCPMGLFSALVIHLLANKMDSELEWELQTEHIFRNAVSLLVGPYDTVTLMLTPTYLEIAMLPNEEVKREVSVEAICTEVKCCIEKAIKKVTSDLHYTSDAEHILAFYCTGSHMARLERHPARIDYFRSKPCSVVCERSGMKCKNKLPAKSLNWFGKVSKSRNIVLFAEVCSDCFFVQYLFVVFM